MNHEEAGAAIGRRLDEKEKACGDALAGRGAILRALYPDGIAPAQYDSALAVIKIIDALYRVSAGREAAGGGAFQEIAACGLLGQKRNPGPKSFPKIDSEPSWWEKWDLSPYRYAVDLEGP